MDAPHTLPPPALPIWRRVWQFPLVVMLVAMALVVLVGAAVTIVVAILTNVFGSGTDEPLAEPVGVMTLVAALIVLQKGVLRRLGERRHDDLRFADAPQGLALGTVAAFGLFSAIVGVAALLGAYRIDGWGGMSNWLFVLFTAGISAGFVEEFVFRGIVFRWIEEFGGSWAALFISSALFGVVHIGNDNATWFSSFAIAIEAGVMFGAAYMLTRSLWMPIGLHFGWNVTQGLVWDVPISGNAVDGLVDARLVGDPLISGGAFGLEASVIALLVAGGFGVWLVRRAASKGEVMQPRWVRRRRVASVPARI